MGVVAARDRRNSHPIRYARQPEGHVEQSRAEA